MCLKCLFEACRISSQFIVFVIIIDILNVDIVIVLIIINWALLNYYEVFFFAFYIKRRLNIVILPELFGYNIYAKVHLGVNFIVKEDWMVQYCILALFMIFL